MKKKTLFLMLVLTCVYSIASAGTIDGTVFGDVQEGVTISLGRVTCGETFSDTVITDGFGDFSFTGVPNGNYTVKAEKTGCSFLPEERSVTISDNYVSADFTAVATTTGRFVDNGNGTVTDTLTDLIWLKNANCFGKQNHGMAAILSEELNSGECGLSDGSVEGDWRYPSKEELQGIGTDPPTTWYEFMPPVSWSMPGAPFVDVRFNSYWSSERSASNSSKAWMVAASNGNTVTQYRVEKYYVWPVRDAN